MIQSRFRGKHEHTIDEKGRLSFPSRFRDILHQYESNVLIITPWANHLRAYPETEWAAIEDKLLAEGSQQPEELRDFIRYVQSRIIECALDKQGRILLPPGLRANLGLKKNIILNGMVHWVEIWDKVIWNERHKATGENFPELAKTIGRMGIL
jgi:MraZ protein